MKAIQIITASMCLLLLNGCAALLGIDNSPPTLAEQHSGYSYIPLDPLQIKLKNTLTKGDVAGGKFLDALPDNTVRIAVQEYTASGNINYGPAAIDGNSKLFKVVLDYINVDVKNHTVYVAKKVQKFMPLGRDLSEYTSIYNKHSGLYHSTEYVVKDSKEYKELNEEVLEYRKTKSFTDELEKYRNTIYPQDEKQSYGLFEFYGKAFYRMLNNPAPAELYPMSDRVRKYLLLKSLERIEVPVYIGVGLRITATVYEIDSTASLTGLGALSGENTKGTMVVQTLGVSGPKISAALPVQSELNQSTIQNAVVTIGSVKALLYDPNVLCMPRVVGIYLPVPADQKLVNQIISNLSNDGLEWVPYLDTSS